MRNLSKEKELVVCNNCVMDSTSASFSKTKMGCNFCEQKKMMSHTVQSKFKPKRNGKYDSVIGLSGGVDSSYALVLAIQKGWKPYVFHLDNGWNSNLAVQNIENLVSKLNLKLNTKVLNWKKFKDIQKSFFESHVLDLELPTDHAIFASLYQFAFRKGIRTVIIGYNNQTENILPKDWAHRKYDAKNILEIHKKYFGKNLSSFPHLNLYKWIFYDNFYIRKYNILDQLNYNKSNAISLLKKEYGYIPYEGKHGESVFTRIYQNYILKEKFGIDKRKAHLSSLIVSGEISRETALRELKSNSYSDSNTFYEDKRLLNSKLGFDSKYLNDYISIKGVPHAKYGTSELKYDKIKAFYRLLKK